jgi:hypothetical protein
MYKIEPTLYGFRISISGRMDMEEAEQASVELLGALAELDHPFSLVIDVRKMMAYEPQVAKAIVALHTACVRMSCERSAVIVESPTLKAQTAQICLSASSKNCDRVIDSSEVSDWEDRPVAWAANAVEPEPAPSATTPA